MKIMIAIFFAFCCLSVAHAHPNHMNFEAVKHDGPVQPSMLTGADKIIHEAKDEPNGHSESVPCTEQHKSLPCKEK